MHINSKIIAVLLTFVVAFSFATSVSFTSAAPTVPSTNNYLFPYDPSFSTRNPNCYYVGSDPRPSQNLPDGYWYPNVNFDSSWFGVNHAFIGADGKAYLRAVSTYDILWGGRGWSNAFVHQGRPPYAGGVYEGHFKAGSNSASAIPVDGIRYAMNSQEPTGKQYIYITATLQQDDLDRWFSSNGLLIGLLFQYEFQDGTLSLYDAPPKTNNYQSLHFDIFIHRSGKIANVPYYYSSGTWSNTLGDAYNNDRHVQYVYNGRMVVGQTYTFVIDLGDVINQLKAYFPPINYLDGLPTANAIILRYVQVSAETCGGQISATIDDFGIITYP